MTDVEVQAHITNAPGRISETTSDAQIVEYISETLGIEPDRVVMVAKKYFLSKKV
jgi:hypothetical protein